MKKSIRVIVIVVILAATAVLVSDCDGSPDSTAPPQNRAVVQPGNGIVKGVVTFTAPKPQVKIIGGDCCPGAGPVPDESTIVNDNGTLANVVIYVKNGPNVAGVYSPIQVDQKDCRYVPHACAVHTNQPIDVSNHDATVHNVHVDSSINPPDNFGETTVGATHRIQFALPEMVHLKCDVHPWMSAYICVFDHPYFAMTGVDGTFEIPKLPRGSYTLEAWHEKYGIVEKQFTINDDKPVEVDFEFGRR